MRVEWEKGNKFEEFLRLEVNGLFLLRLNVYCLAGDVVQECRYGSEQGHEGARVARTKGGESQFRIFRKLDFEYRVVLGDLEGGERTR